MAVSPKPAVLQSREPRTPWIGAPSPSDTNAAPWGMALFARRLSTVSRNHCAISHPSQRSRSSRRTRVSPRSPARSS
jgi:hypothetical protein